MNSAVAPATRATPALMANAVRNEPSVGRPPRAAMLPASTDALTCEPSDEPTERTAR